MDSQPAPAAVFSAVIVGGDIGAYSLARAFNDRYGVRPYLITQHESWVVCYSKILHRVACAAPTDPEALLATLTTGPLESVIDDGTKTLLLGSSDQAVQAIIALRDKLPDGVIAPYVDRERFDLGTMKQNFTELCRRLGISHPTTQFLDLFVRPPAEIVVQFQFPIMVKPADVGAWSGIDFPGKKKVHAVESSAELNELVAAIYAAGYRQNLILQDMIPGNDQKMRTLTCYCDENSRVRFASWGVTLLEEHSPGALGNPVAMVTGKDEETVGQAARLLKELRWVGYANFDLKVDPRDGSMNFIELNPRLGRANFYISGGGHNAATYYVDEYINRTFDSQPDLIQDQAESCFLVVPRRLLLRYITDPEMKRWVRGILRRGGARNPLWNPADDDPRRRLFIALAQLNYVKKFLTYYRARP